MKNTITKIGIFCAMALSAGAANAQSMTDTTTEFKPHGNLWGYTFGDFAYKGSGDNLNRGGSNQYTGMPANANTFQFRRIYHRDQAEPRLVTLLPVVNSLLM